MSVLYKALARAAKANKAARAEPEPVPAAADLPVLDDPPRRGRAVVRAALLGTVAALAVVVGALFAYPEETLSLVEEMTGAVPPPVLMALRADPAPPRPQAPPRDAAEPPPPPETESVPDAEPVGASEAAPGTEVQPAPDAEPAAPEVPEVAAEVEAPAAEEPAAVAAETSVAAPPPPAQSSKPAPAPAPEPDPASAPDPKSEPAPEPAPDPESRPAPAPEPPAAAAPALPEVPAEPPAPPSRADLETLLTEMNRREQEEAATPVKVARADARPSLDESIRVTETAPERRDAGRAAFAALLRGAHEEALALYDEAARLNPGDPAVLMGRATALHKLGRNEEARAGYERVLAVDPGNRAALTNLLALVGEQAPRDALAELERLRARHPRFGPVLAQIAQTHARLGDLEQAVAHMAAALEVEPHNVLYLYNLAVLQDQAGFATQAAASYEGVLAAVARGAAPGLALDEAGLRARLRHLKGR